VSGFSGYQTTTVDTPRTEIEKFEDSPFATGFKVYYETVRFKSSIAKIFNNHKLL
jgi:hypothetical protein